MPIRPFKDKRPHIGARAYVDESATLIGDVRIGEESSVWPGAVVRADDDIVELGKRSALMDVAFAEAPRGRPVIVGDECIISHGARLHGCEIGDRCLVAIGAIVLDGAKIGNGSVVAAGAIVTPGTEVPAGSFLVGAPAKVTRSTTEDEREWTRREVEILVKKAALYSVQQHH